MLVLSRKIMESVVLQIKTKDGTVKEVTVRVIEMGNRKVRLGFETDPEVVILREELLMTKKDGKQPQSLAVAK